MMLRVAKANDYLDLEQIDRLYTEFTEGKLNQPALRFAIQLYLGGSKFSRDPFPYNDVTTPGDGTIVVAAGLAVGFEQNRFTEEAIQCIATAASAAGVDAAEIASARDLLDMDEYGDEWTEESSATARQPMFETYRRRSAGNAA